MTEVDGKRHFGRYSGIADGSVLYNICKIIKSNRHQHGDDE